MAIKIKNRNEIQLMRQSGRLAQRILNRLGEAVGDGVTTQQLDAMARRWLEEAGARSPFYGYKGGHHTPFPGVICTSLNEAVVHGVPGPQALQNGDVIALDVGTVLSGWIGDTAGTFGIGDISPAAERLLRVTREALYLGIEKAVVGNHIGDIGSAIQMHVETHGYAVVHDLVGHGVGRSIHEDPAVPNYGERGRGLKLRPGMTIAIEPMVNAGSERVECLADDWTCVSVDRSLSAHFEHTVAILSDGPEILTRDE